MAENCPTCTSKATNRARLTVRRLATERHTLVLERAAWIAAGKGTDDPIVAHIDAELAKRDGGIASAIVALEPAPVAPPVAVVTE